jgi:hypothetical protein
MAQVKAYRCSHSGLYFPEEYVKQWGRVYGKGLGKHPVSTVYDSKDIRPFVDPLKHPSNLRLKPVGVTRAQLDFVMVDEAEFNANRAIIPDTPENKLAIAKIMADKQMKKHRANLERTYKQSLKEVVE